MYASRNVRKAEVIALVPAAQHNAHAEDVGEGNFRTMTADADATRPHTLSA
jgi:hypothetical protein